MLSKENMAHWNALGITNPKFAKAVTFGRKFTSVNPQWQIMRMTQQFGPVGQGWGYDVQHSIERIHEWHVLAVADVTIWWRDSEAVTIGKYGPIRGAASMISPVRDKGVLVFEKDSKMVKVMMDDDAPKKAMTDAITKGLSHIGISADVFLGMFDDQAYVKNVAEKHWKEANTEVPFKASPSGRDNKYTVTDDGEILEDDPLTPPPTNGKPTSNWVQDAQNDGTLDPTRTKGSLAKSPDEATTKRVAWVNAAIESFKGHKAKVQATDWWKAEEARRKVIERDLPEDYQRLVDAYDLTMERLSL